MERYTGEEIERAMKSGEGSREILGKILEAVYYTEPKPEQIEEIVFLSLPCFEQKQESSCGFANLRTVLNHYGVEASEEDFYKYSDCPRRNFVSGPYEMAPLELAVTANKIIEERKLDLELEAWVTIENSLEYQIGEKFGKITSALDLLNKGKKYIPTLKEELKTELKPIRGNFFFNPSWEILPQKEKVEWANDFLYKLQLLESLNSSKKCTIHYSELEGRRKKAKEALDNGIPFLMAYNLHWWTAGGYIKEMMPKEEWLRPDEDSMRLIMYNSNPKRGSLYESRALYRDSDIGEFIILNQKKMLNIQ